LSSADAVRTVSAKGDYVFPGLVDLHAHVLINGHDMGTHNDSCLRATGVTTLCDAGSTGSSNFAGLRNVLDHHVHTRVRAFVNLSAIGITGTARGGELSHFPYADPAGCDKTIKHNPALHLGVKLPFGPNLVWGSSAEPVKLARRTAHMAGNVPM